MATIMKEISFLYFRFRSSYFRVLRTHYVNLRKIINLDVLTLFIAIICFLSFIQRTLYVLMLKDDNLVNEEMHCMNGNI
jgi:hypothetical protein